MKSSFLLIVASILTIFSCGDPDAVSYDENARLPILGERAFVNGDTVYHTAPDFDFINQDSVAITPALFENRPYIVDYFFTTCPTICPRVKAEEIRVFDHFENRPELGFLSVSIDAGKDKVYKLKEYADKLGVGTPRWHFVTGDEDHIYDIANDFFHIAQKDPDAPGGFDHDGRLILIDKNKNIRAFCDGTDAKQVDRFIKDVEKLLREK